LPIGENEVVIEKEGYRSMKEKITVDNSNIQFNFTLQQIEPVLVKLRSNPDGATIYINNSERGTASRELWLFPGIYEITLMKSQYQSINELIEIEWEKRKSQIVKKQYVS